MFGHWLTMAWRVVKSDKAFTLITMLSLSVGAMAAVLIGSFLHEELNHERWLTDSDRILRVETTFARAGRPPIVTATTFPALKPALDARLPELAATSRLTLQWNTIERGEDRESYQVAFVDPEFFDLFKLPFVEGDAETALATPNSLVLSETAAKRFFGGESPIGEILVIERPFESVVTGVVRDLPNATHLLAPMIARLDNEAARANTPFDENWDSFSAAQLYAKASSPEHAARLVEELPSTVASIVAASTEIPDGVTFSFDATPIRAIHFSAPKSGDLKPRGDPVQLSLFAAIATVLLVVSGFNFVILSVARGAQRTREVGLRKAVGADRGVLMKQYFVESALFTLGGVLIGYAAAELAHPWFARLVGRDLELSTLRDPAFLATGVAVVAGLIVVIGAYPAVFLSSLRPASALRGRERASAAAPIITMSLVTVQFAAAIALTAAAIIMASQIHYIMNKPLGFEPADRFILHGVRRDGATTLARLETFKTRLRAHPAIRSVSATSVLPDWDLDDYGAFLLPGQTFDEGARSLFLSVDVDFLKNFEMPVVAGRDFDIARARDRYFYDHPTFDDPPEILSAVITRSALGAVGAETPEAAVGKVIDFDFGGGGFPLEIVGVIDNVNYRSLRHEVEPLVMVPMAHVSNVFTIHFDPARHGDAALAIEAVWNETYPDQLMSLDYVDQEMIAQYDDDRRLLRLALTFAFVAVAIACLGLYGLAAFSVQRRTKEVGVRKALGATTGQVTVLMLWRFAVPVVVANVIAWPAAFFAMRAWLGQFAYHVPLNVVPFAVASAAGLAVALAAVGGHALRAAATRPALALRVE